MHPLMNLIVAFFALMVTVPTAATQSAAPAAPTALRVALLPDPPFVIKEGDGTYSGLAVELWERIALDLGVTFFYLPCNTPSELIEVVSTGKCDVGVGDISITHARFGKIDFSHPYFDSGLRVMINESNRHSFTRLWQGLSERGYLALAAIASVVVLFATVLLTLVNRRFDETFSRHWHTGLAESFYHVMSVTMTGKSNHKGLPGPLGRVLAGIWIGCGVALVAFITSSITSVMTTESMRSEISGPNDLAGKTVGVISGTVGVELARERGWDTQEFAQLESAVSALVAREIQAVVHDAPVLEYYDKSHPEMPIKEVGPLFDTQKYGFALPRESPHRTAINIALLKLHDADYVERLDKQYFGNP